MTIIEARPEQEGDLPDALDRMAGIAATAPLFGLRRARPEYVAGIAACRSSVLTPNDDQGLPTSWRIALALRMARLIGVEAQVAYYQQALAALEPDVHAHAVACGVPAHRLSAPFIALATHCDNVTKHPQHSDRQDIVSLQHAGLRAPQIVALSELIAFINFESRIVAGLTMLGAPA